jgi:predicted transcriptional regulator
LELSVFVQMMRPRDLYEWQGSANNVYNKAKMMKKGRKLSELSISILENLYKDGKEAVQAMIEVHDYDRFVRLRLYKQVDNLHRHGFVKKVTKKNQSFFHLTPKGKLAILKYLHLEKLQKTKWDGRWRVAIFDIPEDLKKWRNYLRSELRNLGFEKLQESVYITPYPVTGELDELLNEWGLRDYFRYLTVTEIDGEPDLKKQFRIK